MTRVRLFIPAFAALLLQASSWSSLAQTCTGDCNGDGQVAINELIAGVNVALGNAALDSCPVGDADGSGTVEINELISAVNNALGGCAPGGPTPSPTPVLGEPSIPRRAAGVIIAHLNVFTAIPDLLGPLLGQTRLTTPGSGAETVFEIPFSCPASGSGTLRCDQDIFPPFPPSAPVYRIVLDACTFDAAGGRSVTFDGTIRATGEENQICGQIPAHVRLAFPDLTLLSAGAQGTTTASFSELHATAQLSGSDPTCQYDTLDLQLSGNVTVQNDDAAGIMLDSNAAFDDASLVLTVDQFDPVCLPEIYAVTMNGDATLTARDEMFAASYEEFQLRNDTTSGNRVAMISGTMTSDCLGETVEIATPEAVVLPVGRACPEEGRVTVTSSRGTDAIRYDAGAVQIELVDDGTEAFGSCVDPRLFACPAP